MTAVVKTIADSRLPATVPEAEFRLAQRFAELAGASGLALGALDRQVVELAMRAVAEAERRLEQQRQRIDYLESLSITDELTGVRNRRGFRIEMMRALADAARSGQGGVVLMIDLDGFKGINDVHGHGAGDKVLESVAMTLADHVRPGDTVARLGGDEFAVLMPNAESKDGLARASEIGRLLNSRRVRWQNAVIPFSASVGIATYHPGEQAEAVLARADRTLYRDKRSKPIRHLRLAH
jgi:diguanylate cyclase (GGDEF)-like protein